MSLHKKLSNRLLEIQENTLFLRNFHIDKLLKNPFSLMLLDKKRISAIVLKLIITGCCKLLFGKT